MIFVVDDVDDEEKRWLGWLFEDRFFERNGMG